MIEFFVPGKPQALKRHRTYRMPNGKTVRVDPSRTAKDDFLAKAMEHRPEEPLRGPIYLGVKCLFPRPKSHYRTGKYAHTLKDNAPQWHTSVPDTDNILKFIGDALNGIFWLDDRQIVWVRAMKRYGDTPGIEIKIEDIQPLPYKRHEDAMRFVLSL